MRKTQFNTLCVDEGSTEPDIYRSYKSKMSETIKISWISDINELPRKEASHFFLANEFFDALPIQKFKVNSFSFKSYNILKI